MQAIVDAVKTTRDKLGMPSILRDVEGTQQKEIPEAAEIASEDSLIQMGPAELEPTVVDVESMFRNAW